MVGLTLFALVELNKSPIPHPSPRDHANSHCVGEVNMKNAINFPHNVPLLNPNNGMYSRSLPTTRKQGLSVFEIAAL